MRVVGYVAVADVHVVVDELVVVFVVVDVVHVEVFLVAKGYEFCLCIGSKRMPVVIFVWEFQLVGTFTTLKINFYFAIRIWIG